MVCATVGSACICALWMNSVFIISMINLKKKPNNNGARSRGCNICLATITKRTPKHQQDQLCYPLSVISSCKCSSSTASFNSAFYSFCMEYTGAKPYRSSSSVLFKCIHHSTFGLHTGEKPYLSTCICCYSVSFSCLFRLCKVHIQGKSITYVHICRRKAILLNDILHMKHPVAKPNSSCSKWLCKTYTQLFGLR